MVKLTDNDHTRPWLHRSGWIHIKTVAFSSDTWHISYRNVITLALWHSTKPQTCPIHLLEFVASNQSKVESLQMKQQCKIGRQFHLYWVEFLWIVLRDLSTSSIRESGNNQLKCSHQYRNRGTLAPSPPAISEIPTTIDRDFAHTRIITHPLFEKNRVWNQLF